MKHEWRKHEKEIYLPKTTPTVVSIPALDYFVVSGQCNPNSEAFGEYIQALYTVSYGVRMSYKSDNPPKDYYDYTVYPLEGIWSIADKSKYVEGELNKDNLKFDLMIRQPSFVNEAFAKEIITKATAAKKLRRLKEVRFERLEEGLCIQMMHIGLYDDEPATFKQMEGFCAQNGYKRLSKDHREIYITDPRKAEPQKMKTTLRFLASEV